MSSFLMDYAEHSNYIDVGNQVFTRLWQECFAFAFLLAYDVCALPTVFVYVGTLLVYWSEYGPKPFPVRRDIIVCWSENCPKPVFLYVGTLWSRGTVFLYVGTLWSRWTVFLYVGTLWSLGTVGASFDQSCNGYLYIRIAR